MRESDVGTELDVPHTWVIEVETTVAGAREVGKVLGAHGFTGRFIDGDIAGLARDGARWRKHMKGGDDNGQLDKAVPGRAGQP